MYKLILGCKANEILSALQWSKLIFVNCFRSQRHHDNITLWLVKWLAFRLVFCSGVVKLSSRCPTWWGLTALDWHYESQVCWTFSWCTWGNITESLDRQNFESVGVICSLHFSYNHTRVTTLHFCYNFALVLHVSILITCLLENLRLFLEKLHTNHFWKLQCYAHCVVLFILWRRIFSWRLY